MTTLTLPEPAGHLWLATRDVLTTLGTSGKPWSAHLGGGTIIAARVHHRESTDIDIVIRNTDSLAMLRMKDEHNLAKRLRGKPIRESDSQIKVELASGIIDVSTVAVRPRHGSERVRIAGRIQHVLSNTQILRGKLNRATDPAPVRDVYDVIRLGQDANFEREVAAAYNLLTTEGQDAVENTWKRLDKHYEQQAAKHLQLTEKPCTDMRRLGSLGAELLDGQRLSRVIIELENDRILIERTIRNGKAFEDRAHANKSGALQTQTGVTMTLAANGLDTRAVTRRIVECRAQRVNGVIFDSADPRPLDRFTGKNRSMKRHNQRIQTGARELLPPSAAIVSGGEIDHSKDTEPDRGSGPDPHGINSPGQDPTNKRGTPEDNNPGGYDI